MSIAKVNTSATHRLTFSEQLSIRSDCLLLLTPLWQVQAFECAELPWETQFPALAKAVWQIDDSEIDTIDADQTALVECLLPSLQLDLASNNLSIDGLFELLTSKVKAQVEVSVNQMQNKVAEQGLTESELSHFSAHIKGRKWQQITAFAHFIPADDLPILEWCAGKGHLGRYLAKKKATKVTSLEWQQSLCEQGQAFADKWHLPQTFTCTDVFEIANSPLINKQHAVALHACGDLHVRLIDLAVQASTRAISFSPCCYHLIQASHYQALSDVAKDSGLTFSRHDLQLPLQQSVIANPKQQLLRHQEISWRLGFDSLQRDITGSGRYLPIPSVKRSQLSASFDEFCRWAANQKGVALNGSIDFDDYLIKGEHRQALTRRIDLVAHLFRLIIEQWLLLDRVCFLEQHGYQVEMFEFCANSITPRNCLIQAKKQP
ncbi:methyltransferase [Shewanella sp. UCD-FRSSP16_17]|uniref:methyltransferase n=1 Tax=Shewanella sp. UCD-FRSSP16_17 TaxID=1853256 RepID=UPI000A440C4F|nr:methyltransferase [Shewanella sp. MMG014]